MGTAEFIMGVCESSEYDDQDGQGADFHAAAMSSSGKTHLTDKYEYEMSAIRDPSGRLEVGEEYVLEMSNSRLDIKDDDDVIWTLSYFDIIAWGSSRTTFKLVLKMSQNPKQKATATKPGSKEPTFEVKFQTHQGKLAALTIRSYCLNLLEEMEDADAERKLAEREKEWEAIMNRTEAEKSEADAAAEAAGDDEPAADDASTASAADEDDDLDMMSIATLYHNKKKVKRATDQQSIINKVHKIMLIA